jgi:hypothetical protein
MICAGLARYGGGQAFSRWARRGATELFGVLTPFAWTRPTPCVQEEGAKLRQVMAKDLDRNGRRLEGVECWLKSKPKMYSNRPRARLAAGVELRPHVVSIWRWKNEDNVDNS